MRNEGGRWAIVLGAGDGTRLSTLTTRKGVAVPKQFCMLNGGPSLLQLALRRAERVVAPERVMTVVAAGHRRWWEHDLRTAAPRSVVVQPQNRGTAAGVLLPLAALRAIDAEATVAILPSDHWVADERVLAREMRRAFDSVEVEPDSVALLGIEPDSPETGYGWILPGAPSAPGVYEVRAFVEKPAAEVAQRLFGAGAAWNGFLLVARLRTLWTLYEKRLPELVDRLASGFDPDGRPDEARMERIYADLPVRDFSREVLQGAEGGLRLLRVPECGWTDLGTPERVAACVERVLSDPAARMASPRPMAARIDLAWALAGA
jgi:mannose-1-phosphate guanylyltransferase